MSIYRIKMNGKTYEMEIDLIEEGKPKKEQPAPVVSKPIIQEPTGVEKPAEVNPNAITAPMPGSIIQVMVNAGDEVKENDVILILEAMKMENEIMCPKDGTVTSVTVSAGTTVESGQVLCTVQ